MLRDFGRSDWKLATMVCQMLWNYSGKITSANAFFGETEANDLVEVLLEFLGELQRLNLLLTCKGLYVLEFYFQR